MARKGTSNLNLGTWSQGENPGAGSQDVDNAGLNGNVIKIDTAVGTEHNANGTHKAAIIDKGNLKSTVADGSSIELNGTNGLQLKDLGVSTGKLANLAVTTDKLAAECVTNLKIAPGAIDDPQYIADNVILTRCISDDAVTAPKISHDNNRTKALFVFCHDSTPGAGAFLKALGITTSASNGYRMPRAGSITKVAATLCYPASGHTVSYNYGVKAFAAETIMACKGVTNQGYDFVRPVINGVEIETAPTAGLRDPVSGTIVVVEVEFDD